MTRRAIPAALLEDFPGLRSSEVVEHFTQPHRLLLLLEHARVFNRLTSEAAVAAVEFLRTEHVEPPPELLNSLQVLLDSHDEAYFDARDAAEAAEDGDEQGWCLLSDAEFRKARTYAALLYACDRQACQPCDVLYELWFAFGEFGDAFRTVSSA
jgi:hypothetical protein